MWSGAASRATRAQVTAATGTARAGIVVEQAIELLLGKTAGEANEQGEYAEGTVFASVADRFAVWHDAEKDDDDEDEKSAAAAVSAAASEPAKAPVPVKVKRKLPR